MLRWLLYQVVNLYSFCILVYCIFTWFPISQGGTLGTIFGFLKKICDPYLNLFRKILPPIGGTVDVTPILALLVLQLVVGFIARLL